MEKLKIRELPFAYSIQKLANNFLDETHTDKDLAQQNLVSFLQKKFPGSQKALTDGALIAIINDVLEGVDFGYLALMMANNHPLLKGWGENEKRRDLHYILGRRILDLENDLVALKLGVERFGNTQTKESIRKELIPYKNFQEKLLDRATPTPKDIRNK